MYLWSGLHPKPRGGAYSSPLDPLAVGEELRPSGLQETSKKDMGSSEQSKLLQELEELHCTG